MKWPARILAIDDDPTNVALLQVYLRQAGYEVSNAPNGFAGLEMARERLPDLIVLDVVMPGLDGYEVSRRLKSDERTAAIPILMLTSLQDHSSKIAALENGAIDFLTKPVDRTELLARIRTSLQIKALHDELAASETRQRGLVVELTRTVDRLKGLGEVNRLISSNLDLDDVLTEIVTRAVQLCGADDGIIREYDAATRTLPYRASHGLSRDAIDDLHRSTDLSHPEDGGILNYVVRTGRLVQLADVQQALPSEIARGQAGLALRQERWRRQGIRALLVLPLIAGELLGLLVVHRKMPGEFPPETVELLQAFAAQSCTAIKNARLFGQLQQESALVQRQSRTLSAIMGSMSDGLLVADASGFIRYANPKAEGLLAAPSSVVGLRLTEALGRGIAASGSDLESAVKRAPERPAVELTLEGPPRRHLLALVFPVTNMPSDGLDIGVLLHDVTQERDLIRTKDELISVVSHELRTPLASLVGFAELLLEQDGDDGQRHEFLTIMYDEGRRLTALITDFLDLQRMESGRQSSRLEPLELAPVLRRAAVTVGQDEFRPIALAVSGDLPKVNGDPDRLHQVLVNLLSNARKYSPNGGEIRVSGSRAGGASVEVTVEDHGLGLPPEALGRLFEKFYRVDSPDRRSITGTGLGLAICRQIVAEHGSQLLVDSAGPGLGSKFSFLLHAAQPQRDAGHKESVVAPGAA